MAAEQNHPSERPSSSANPVSCFETTHWSVVLLAAGRSSAEAERALAELCQAYWMPLYVYVRSRVGDPHHAQDLTQAFFAKLLEKDYLQSVDPAKGRFRAFLLTATKCLISNEWDKHRALKRGGGHTALSLDFEAANLRFANCDRRALTAEQVFLRDWVRTLLDRVFDQIQREFDSAGNADQFAELKAFITVDGDARQIPEVAQRLGISAGTARVGIHRLRRRYRQVLRDHVAETVENPADVEDEIRSLFAAFE